MSALVVQNLTKIYRSGFIPRRRQALKDVSFEVARGEVFGFLGPNGAGKTTTLKVIVGLLRPTSGVVTIFGLRAGTIQARSKLGFLPENPYFYQFLNADEFLRFYADLCGLPRPDARRRIPELLRMVGLDDSPGLPIRKYSKGMVQRLGLAQALISDPDLLVLDEPLSGLDPVGRKEFRDIILGLRDRGKTVFFSSHILQDAEMICNRVGILVNGQLRKSGSLQELTSGDVTGYEISLVGCEDAALADVGKIVTRQDLTTYLLVENQGALGRAISAIQSRGGKIVSVVPVRRTLEDVFMKEVGAGNAGGMEGAGPA
ncbi:MAG: ABC transporter ATP-binding protein [Acidobacteriota bacterium]